MLRIRCLALLIGALLLTTLALAAPVTTTAGKKGEITLDFKDVELTDLIQTVSELTGKNFVYDDSVRGKVTIVSPRGMSANEAYQVFLSVLGVKGFTIVPAGKANKIVRTQDARESGLPTGSEAAAGGADQYVTRLVPLQHVDATALASTVLTPLIPKTSSVVPYAPTNTLIITDSSANIERLVKIIAELDVPGAGSSLDVFFLQHAAAEEVAQLGTQVLAQLAGSPQRARGPATAGGTAAVAGKVLAYPRANAIVVMADSGELETIRALVRDLDRQPNANRANINVVYLENADAEALSKTLGDIFATRQKSGKSGTDPIGITADKATNSLVVNSTPEEYATVREIVRQLDIKRKQVFVEALILELSLEATQDLGISFSGGVATSSNGGFFGSSNQAVNSFSDTSLLTSSVKGILAGGFSKLISVTDPNDASKTIQIPAFSALLRLSKGNTDVNILSAPRLLTSDNEEAQIVVGDNVPIITSRLTSGASTDLNQSVTIERKDAALTLKLTPQITEGDLVRLKIYQEITGVKDTSSSTSSFGSVDQVGPTLTKRLLQNTVIAEDGKTVVLGGLINNNRQVTVSKVPLLGDIPVLGWLFKTRSTVEKKTNLMIFITPHIIRTAADLKEVTQGSRAAMEEFRTSEMRDTPQQSDYTRKALEAIGAQGAAAAGPAEYHE